MAYNPFDFFRRNQKVFFAGLTILVMFMFVLSFGRGDFFSWFPEQLRKWQTTGEVVATIDGAKVKESQLGDVSATRGLANGYMLQAAEKALAADAKAADAAAQAAGPDNRPQLTRLANSLNAARVQANPRSAEDAVRFRAAITEVFIRPALKIEEQPAGTEADKKAAQAVRLLAEGLLGEMTRRGGDEKGEGGVYFANQPNRTGRDQLEFLLWKKKADQLGIRFTHDDVVRLVAAEFPSNALSADELSKLADQVAATQGKKKADLLDALADEFRVRAAQSAVMGADVVRNPAADPPGTTRGRFEHFQELTAATLYSFLTIPVEAYLPRVTGEPTEAELTKLFNDLGGIDPDPSSPRSGVREPRKVGVQWVEITGQEPYYADLAAKRAGEFKKLQSDPAMAALVGPTVPPAAAAVGYDRYLKVDSAINEYRRERRIPEGERGYDPLNMGVNPGRPALPPGVLAVLAGGAAEEQLRQEYARRKDVYYFDLFSHPKADARDKLLDAEVYRPELAVALTGLFAGGLATGGTPFAAPVATTDAAYRQSREQRVLAGIRAFHAPLLPGLAELNQWVGGEAAATLSMPAPLPEEAVRPVLDRQTTEQLRTLVATEDVLAFEKELARITKPATGSAAKADDKAKAKKEAAEYVAKWVAERKVKTGTTAEPRDVQALADDPGLAPLLAKDVNLLDPLKQAKNARARTAFGQVFVNDASVEITPDFRNTYVVLKPSAGVYQVREYDPGERKSERQDYAPLPGGGMFARPLQVTTGRPLTLIWRTDEIDAKRPLSLATPGVRDKLKAVWRLNKARELARQAANEAAEVVRAAGADEFRVSQQMAEALAGLKKPITDPQAAGRFREVMQADDFTAAKLLLRPPFGGIVPLVAEFNPQHPTIVYETEKMKEELLANRDKPVGTTFVFTDRPETTFYLAVVSGKEQKDRSYFRNFVLDPDEKQIEQAQKSLGQYQQLGLVPASSRPLTPQEVDPRYAVTARTAARRQAVALLKAEFNYQEAEKDGKPVLDARESK